MLLFWLPSGTSTRWSRVQSEALRSRQEKTAAQMRVQGGTQCYRKYDELKLRHDLPSPRLCRLFISATETRRTSADARTCQ